MLTTTMMSLHTRHLIDRTTPLTYSRCKLWVLTNRKHKLLVSKSNEKSESFSTISKTRCLQVDLQCLGQFSTNIISNFHTQERFDSSKVLSHFATYKLNSTNFVRTRNNSNVILRHCGVYRTHCRCYSSNKDEVFNPIDKLQAFVNVPLLPPEKHLFKPSRDEIQKAESFWIKGMQEIKFVKSAKFQDQLPADNISEVTFIGRSNVGKSSLIQAMFIQSDVMVHISKTPGHTKLLNFFEVKDHFRLVDVPGYGFNMPENYSEMVETFLINRPRLCRTFLLLDGASGLNKTDMIGINMAEEFQIPFVFVITKIDKVSPAVLVKNLISIQQVMKNTRYCFPQPFLVSAKTGDGIQLLQAFITYVTGNIAIGGM